MVGCRGVLNFVFKMKAQLWWEEFVWMSEYNKIQSLWKSIPMLFPFKNHCGDEDTKKPLLTTAVSLQTSD